MKILNKSVYHSFEVSTAFNNIILKNIESYEGTKKEQLKSFFEDLQRGGCISGIISEFIYHNDCKEFYIKHLDDLENIKADLEETLGLPIINQFKNPHYTFVCWLCFEEYCFDIYRSTFE